MGMERFWRWMPFSTIPKQTRPVIGERTSIWMGWFPMTIGMYFWSNNMGRCAAMAQGETILKPALKIQPSRKTLLAESTNTFFASGGTGTLTWAFVKNPSGGTIPATYPTSMVYRAGTDFLVYRRAGGLGRRGSAGPGVCQCHRLERGGAERGRPSSWRDARARAIPSGRPRTIWRIWPSTRCSTGATARRISNISIP